MTWFSLRSGTASTGVFSTAYTPQPASATAATRTRKRLRMQYSISLSIMAVSLLREPSRGGQSPGPARASALFQPRDEVAGLGFLQATLHTVADLESVQQFGVLDPELHRHGLHDAGDVLVVEGDGGLVRVQRGHLA